MASSTLFFSESYSSSSNKTLIKSVSLPTKAKITSVTVPGVAASKISYTFNEVTGELTVTLNSVPYTDSKSNYSTHSLTSSSISGNLRQCRYYISSTVGEAIQYVQSNESCPLTYRSSYSTYSFDYVATVVYETNSTPTITLSTTDNRTLYENDTFNLAGTFNDPDNGNVLSVKYSINNVTARALTSAISDGTAKTFNRVLTYKNNKLYDGTTVLTNELAEGTQHTIKVWAEDDQGGRSQEQLRIFYVVANRAPILTINPFTTATNLLNSDSIKLSGSVSDPDGNQVKVEHKIGSGSYTEIYNGTGGTFEALIPLSLLKAGNNSLSIRSTDSYGATTIRNFNLAKEGSSFPLKESVRRYRITPPNGSAQGLLLWVQRQSGDLNVSAEISMTAAGEPENFVPMNLNSTVFLNGIVEEDEFSFEGTEAKNNIILKLKMTRESPASTADIILLNGVLS